MFLLLAIFAPADIKDWIREDLQNNPNVKYGERTAMCPECGIDSVIGSASGYPITTEFLQGMHAEWFLKGKTLWFSSDG